MREAELRALGADAADRPLAELPTLPKSTMMAEFDRRAQIVLAAGASAHVPERLRLALVAAIGSTGAVPPNVDVEPVPALEREPGGKTG